MRDQDREMRAESTQMVNAESDHPAIARLERDMTRQVLEAHSPAARRVCQIDAGTGEYSIQNADHDHRVCAVDLRWEFDPKPAGHPHGRSSVVARCHTHSIRMCVSDLPTSLKPSLS